METNKKETKSTGYNVFQICNIYKIVGHIRTHLMKKYKGLSTSKTEWKKILKKERIDF